MEGKTIDVFYVERKESAVVLVPSASITESSTGSEELKSSWSVSRVCLGIADTVNQILIISLTVFLLRYALQYLTTTNLHVTLCTVGYVLLMSEAIGILAGENILTSSLTRRAKAHIHWILQVLGIACNIAGVTIMYRTKTVHFQSIHGITGIVSLGIMCFLGIFGYPVLFAIKLRKLVRPVIVKGGHNFLGILCYVIGMVSQCYGYQKAWLRYNTVQFEGIESICTALTAIIVVLSLRGALHSLYRQMTSLIR